MTGPRVHIIPTQAIHHTLYPAQPLVMVFCAAILTICTGSTAAAVSGSPPAWTTPGWIAPGWITPQWTRLGVSEHAARLGLGEPIRETVRVMHDADREEFHSLQNAGQAIDAWLEAIQARDAQLGTHPGSHAGDHVSDHAPGAAALRTAQLRQSAVIRMSILARELDEAYFTFLRETAAPDLARDLARHPGASSRAHALILAERRRRFADHAMGMAAETPILARVATQDLPSAFRDALGEWAEHPNIAPVLEAYEAEVERLQTQLWPEIHRARFHRTETEYLRSELDRLMQLEQRRVDVDLPPPPDQSDALDADGDAGDGAGDQDADDTIDPPVLNPPPDDPPAHDPPPGGSPPLDEVTFEIDEEDGVTFESLFEFIRWSDRTTPLFRRLYHAHARAARQLAGTLDDGHTGQQVEALPRHRLLDLVAPTTVQATAAFDRAQRLALNDAKQMERIAALDDSFRSARDRAALRTEALMLRWSQPDNLHWERFVLRPHDPWVWQVDPRLEHRVFAAMSETIERWQEEADRFVEQLEQLLDTATGVRP